MTEEHSPRVDGFNEVVIYCDTNRIWCMGEDMDHPKVYYTIPDDGEVVCGYCDIKFRLKKPS
jgi:uncharacterized Zn-finger protein